MNFRSKLGVLAAVLVIASAVCWIWYPDRPELLGSLSRVAIVLSVVWVMLPETATPISLGWIAGLVLAAVFLWKLPAPLRWSLILGSPALLILFWPHLRPLIAEARRNQAAARSRSTSRSADPPRGQP